MHNAWSGIEEVPYYLSRSSIKFQGYIGQKFSNLILISVFLDESVSLIAKLPFGFDFTIPVHEAGWSYQIPQIFLVKFLTAILHHMQVTWSQSKWASGWLLVGSYAMPMHQDNNILNSLAPGRFKWNFRWVIFNLILIKLILVIDDCVISFEIALRWMSVDLTDNKSTLVQVMAWCHQATSHYLIQCWPRSVSPFGSTRPNVLKLLNLLSAMLKPFWSSRWVYYQILSQSWTFCI